MPNLTAKSYSAQYYAEHCAAGLDYATYGDWQRDYGRWIVDNFLLNGKVVLDAGCACGAIAQGIEDAGAFCCAGVDLCEPMIEIGRKKFPRLRLAICDCVNLHLFADATFDFVHSAQVAEHWRPACVPLILAELARVTRPGGQMFLCLDTVELFARQDRDVLKEDPTHICIQSRAWWLDQLTAAGWRDVATNLPRFREHDWDFFVQVKAN